VHKKKADPHALFCLLAQQEHDGKPSGRWLGHSRFQCPSFVLNFAGGSAARLTIALYQRAQGVSYKAKGKYPLSFKVRSRTIEENTGMSKQQVQYSGLVLERKGHISRKRVRSDNTGEFRGNHITLLNPRTGSHWDTAPGKPGLLSENNYDDFMTIPKDALASFRQITRHGLGVLLAAYEAISKAHGGTESALVGKQELQKVSGLGKDAFRAGVAECVRLRLFSFKGGILTVHDPSTRRPTQRWRNKRATFHQRTKKYAFDLNDRTADDYRTLLTKVLKMDCSDIEEDGDWHRIWPCPLCLNEQNSKITKRPTFAVHIDPSVAGWHCYLCGRKGKLVELAAQVLNITTSQAVEYFRLLLNPPVPDEVAVAV
jgi:hypothetical protein